MQPTPSDPRAPEASAVEDTVAGVSPVGFETGHGIDAPADPIERAALQRAMARLVPDDYQPVRLGRFVLLERIGAGGMGVVHNGYDDTLDRRVALKLIGAGRGASELARRRLFREAQLMAKLSHPNIVAVYEAGEQEGHLFIAMELVEGPTLRQWMRAAERTWSEVLHMFVQVGEGLAAAHAAGVIHRDFKPDNVLVGSDGRPKVADFGLANLERRPEDSLGSTGSISGASSSIASGPLTMTGELMGTPAYMAPEQFRRRQTDGKSDQFSFCVALYEALYGERPFVGANAAEIVAAIEDGEIQPTPTASVVPGWVRAAVVRGLSARRRDRHADMPALLAALAADPHARRRRLVRTATLAGALGGAIVAALVAADRRDRPCADADNRLVGIWDDDARTRIDAAMLATEVGYARDTAARVAAALDRYATAWIEGYRDACEATSVRGVQSAELLDRRMACLEQGRSAMAAAIAELATADATVVEHAVGAIEGLPRLARCADAVALRARVPPPDDPEIAAAVEAMQIRRQAALTVGRTGRESAARTELDALRAEAVRLGHPPLVDEIDVAIAALAFDTAGNDAEPRLRSALGHALAAGDDQVAAEAATGLVLVLGARSTRFAEAGWIADVGLAVAERSRDPLAEAQILNSIGGMALQRGRYDEAEAAFVRGLERVEDQLGDEHGMAAVMHENLGLALESQNRHPEALAEMRTALQIRERSLGPDHPLLAIAHMNLGMTLNGLGRHEEAEAELRHAIELGELSLGADHPDLATAHANLGITLDELGKHAAAQREYRRGIAIVERSSGPEHPDVARGYNNLGASYEDEGRLELAEAEYRRALALSRRAFGDEHPDVSRTLGNLGSVLASEGRHDEAVTEWRASVAIATKVLPAGNADVAYAHYGLCKALIEAGEATAARREALWTEAAPHCDAGGELAASYRERLAQQPGRSRD